ncbi:hypothetical protein [Neorhodopirellula pilleata]|uniref:Uncharacterized protein n=1 Tax=Neorhodopirellula pilleata TaxID=2714738 RepID=A0A5C6A5A5_9BACT|nr:hypothetical protein [Neorhodopirellula pilleata]TWT95114.1 hypothetical protein Pla100_36960 [Neorhodopirellula pilleata]
MSSIEPTESIETQETTETSGPIRTLVIAPGRIPPKYLTESDSIAVGTGISHSKWATLVVLFFVTAALGIPMLWRNERFSLAERLLWSLVVMIYTIAIVALMIVWIRSTVSGIR